VKLQVTHVEELVFFSHNLDLHDLMADPKWAVGYVYDINGVAYRLVTGDFVEGTITFELVEDVGG
jgi:hypothetical protein